MSKAHFLDPVLNTDSAVGLQVDRTGAWLVGSLILALDSESRRRGLLGRDGLDDGEGLVIAPCQGVHTFGMRFPIDIVGIARDGRVIKVRGSVPPRRIFLALSSFAIIELPAGAAGRAGLLIGDQVSSKVRS